MPPVTSHSAFGVPSPGEGNGRIAPPFVGHPTIATPDAAAAPYEDPGMPWESPLDEGTVEPVFEADVSEAEAALAELSQNARSDAEFPLDAFIIPEQSQRVPTGLEGKTATHAEHTPITDLADRLEKLSHRLRVEESETLLSRLAAGDKLDALLAGLLAGYLAGTK